MLQDLIPGSPKFSKDFDGKAFSNVLRMFDICLELPGDSEKYFGFVVEEFSELVHTGKSRIICGWTCQSETHRVGTGFLIQTFWESSKFV